MLYNPAMIFSLLILSPPSSQASLSAYQFANALLLEEHSLYRVFFYHDAAYNGSSLQCIGQGEFDVTKAWDRLQSQYEFDRVVCIAAGLKRGIINETEALRYEKGNHNLNNNITLAGLGELTDAAVNSDRLITFGG